MSEMEAGMTSWEDYLAFKRERSRRDRGKEKSYRSRRWLGITSFIAKSPYVEVELGSISASSDKGTRESGICDGIESHSPHPTSPLEKERKPPMYLNNCEENLNYTWDLEPCCSGGLLFLL